MECILLIRHLHLNIAVVPAVLIADPALSAAQFEIPIHQLSACRFQAARRLMFDVVWAVHKKEAAAAST